jgi:hypothetical protein
MTESDLLFVRNDLSMVLQIQTEKAIQAVDAYDANRLLNTNVDDLIEYFVVEYRIEPIQIDDDQISVDQKETKVDVSRDPSRIIDDRSRPLYVDGTRITFFVPYKGDEQLFFCRPSTFNYNPPRAVIKQDEIHFIYDILDHNVDTVKSTFGSDLGNVKQYLNWIGIEVNNFNQQLAQNIRQRVDWRRQKILQDKGMVSALGFPLRQRENALTTYSVPVVRKKIHTPPPASTTPYMPEPTLEMVQYEQILSIITNMVLVMERSPSAFRDMKEEDLRQHFLVQLNGQFEGQATAETFNFQGKTDILIRENGKNIFIAECKFWRGEKALTDSVDQLLGYTSWRDTKTAILIFNRNKIFSDVTSAIPKILKEHPNFKRQLPCSGETNSRFVFHHNEDPNRDLIITILAFNIPVNG